MGVQATNDGRLGRINTSPDRLASNTHKVGDRVSVHEECSVGDEYGEVVLHVEPLHDSLDYLLRRSDATPWQILMPLSISVKPVIQNKGTYPMVGEGVEAWAWSTNVERTGLKVRMSRVNNELRPIVLQRPRRRFEKANGEGRDQVVELSLRETGE
jgi:hypothetical protein